ncbi:MAG: MFS transporter, partial [Gammaproteobacteria bacterium]
VIGVMITIAFLGGILSHEPIIWASSLLKWQGAFLLLAAIGIVILLLNYLILIDSPLNEKLCIKRKISFSFTELIAQLKQISTNPFTWIGSLYTTFLNLPVILFGALWSTIYLQEAHGLSIANSSIIASLTFLGLIIGTPLVGYYAKNEEKIANILLAGSILSGVFLFLLIYYSGSSFFYLSTIFFLLGFFSSTQSVGYPIVITNSKPELTSLASSVISIFVLGGGTLIKILFGMLLDKHWSGSLAQSGVRLYSVADFNYAMLFVGLFFVASFILAIYYKVKTKNKINVLLLAND